MRVLFRKKPIPTNAFFTKKNCFISFEELKTKIKFSKFTPVFHYDYFGLGKQVLFHFKPVLVIDLDLPLLLFHFSTFCSHQVQILDHFKNILAIGAIKTPEFELTKP